MLNNMEGDIEKVETRGRVEERGEGGYRGKCRRKRGGREGVGSRIGGG